MSNKKIKLFQTLVQKNPLPTEERTSSTILLANCVYIRLSKNAKKIVGCNEGLNRLFFVYYYFTLKPIRCQAFFNRRYKKAVDYDSTGANYNVTHKFRVYPIIGKGKKDKRINSK